MTPSRLRWSALLLGFAILSPTGAGARPVDFVRIEVVSPVPANPVASGRRLLRALAGISGASATNPWLVKVEPGVYDLDGASLVMRKYVDIEGSGEGVTTVQSSVESVGTVQGADHSELRDITVLNFAPLLAIGLASSAEGFSASHVTGVARGGSSGSVALANFAAGGGAFRDMTLQAEGRSATGANMRGGLLLRARVFARGDDFAYGVFNADSVGEVADVSVEVVSDNYATGFRNEGGGPLLRTVRVSSRGDSIGEGIVNGAGSAAQIQGAVIEASGGTSFASGIRNEFSSARISDATITVQGVSSAFGVTSSFSGTPALRNLTVRVTGGGHGVGVRSYGTQVTVEASTISADRFSLENEFGLPTTTISVGASRLEGGISVAAGTVRCVASYDQAFAPLGPTCLP